VKKDFFSAGRKRKKLQPSEVTRKEQGKEGGKIKKKERKRKRKQKEIK